MEPTTIKQLLATAGRPLLSFEFFPPKTEEGMARLLESAARMREARPDFVTVTYGAGGSTRERSLRLCGELQAMGYAVIMPHLTCVGATRAELTETIGHLFDLGYRNIMALRGDPPEGADTFIPPEDGLEHASDLVALIKDLRPAMCCGVAGYPEGHPEAASPDTDLIHLKTKLAAGADFLTTQLFFDNRVYFDFARRCRAAGIYQPVLPGILPAVSLKQVRRMVTMCAARLPPQLEVDLVDAGENRAAAAAVGLQWACRQIDELLDAGAPGIHLYVLNRADVALAPAVARCFARWRGAAVSTQARHG